MLTATIHDLGLFENLLGVINKFTQKCEFCLSTSKVEIFSINQADFPSARLLLDSDVISLDEGQTVKNIKICIRDVIAFKSAISIVKEVDNVNSIQIKLQDIDQSKSKIDENDEDILIKSIKYKSKNGANFNLITIDKSLIANYVSKELKGKLAETFVFNVNPKNLDILQNRTGNVINAEDISVYIHPDETKNLIMLDLMSKNSASTNSIGLPIANSFTGSLDGCPNEFTIAESSFRLFNILRATKPEDIRCFYNKDNKVFLIESSIESKDGFKVNSRFIVGLIKGK